MSLCLLLVLYLLTITSDNYDEYYVISIWSGTTPSSAQGSFLVVFNFSIYGARHQTEACNISRQEPHPLNSLQSLYLVEKQRQVKVFALVK